MRLRLEKYKTPLTIDAMSKGFIASLIITSLVSLVPCMSAPQANVTECRKLSDQVIILDKATENDIILSTYERSIGVTVTVTCALEEFILNGDRELRCLPSGQWNGATPTCQAPGMPNVSADRDTIIIGSTIGTAGFLLVLIVAVSIVCVRQHKCKRLHAWGVENTGTNGQIASRDIQLQEGTYRNSYMQDVHGNSDSCLGNYNTGFTGNERRIYKVWTYQRKQRKHIQADNLRDLKRKGKEIFGYDGVVTIVLCEDGTEIDYDDCLLASADKTLMILQEGEHWTQPRVIYVPWSTFQDAMSQQVGRSDNLGDSKSVHFELGTAQFMMCPLPEGFSLPNVDVSLWSAPEADKSSNQQMAKEKGHDST